MSNQQSQHISLKRHYFTAKQYNKHNQNIILLQIITLKQKQNTHEHLYSMVQVYQGVRGLVATYDYLISPQYMHVKLHHHG